MRVFLMIAWRNVMRNKKRSFITIFAIAFGLMAIIFMWGFIDGFQPMMIENMTSMHMGHMQIGSEKYIEKPVLENAIVRGEPILAHLESDVRVEAFAPRLRTFGLATYAENSQGVAMIGIDSDKEVLVGRLHQFLREGGSFLQGEARGGIVVGATLAKNLDVGMGDELLLVTSNRYSSLSYIGPLPIVGLLESGIPEFDGSVVFLDRARLAESVFIDTSIEFTNPDARIDSVAGVMTEVAIRLADSEEMLALQSDLKPLMPEGVVVRTWNEINPWIEQSVAMREAFTYILLFVLMIVAIAGILNTVLMSVMERTREFGIMRAMGTKSRQVFATVSFESILLGSVGIIIGALGGVGLVLLFGWTGLNVYSSIDSDIMGQFYILDPMVYTRLNLDHFFTTCIIILISVVLISLYPARKAAKMEPVNAIKALG